MAKKHISQKFSFKGILSRNSSYRQDCRTKLSASLIYDNPATILSGIVLRDADRNYPPGKLIGGLTQVQRVTGYTFNYVKNGRLNFSIGGQPYHNEAHHVLPVEAFYHSKWTTPHLHIVKSAKADPNNKKAPGYNINNEDNIIILPQCNGANHIMRYHRLPDHSRNHNSYNIRVVAQCDPIWDMADEALSEPDCDRKKDLRKQIYDRLKQIEGNNFNHLKNLGPNPMS
jgi:hypothetical protein